MKQAPNKMKTSHMNHLQKLSGGLPYARLITKILQHCDIDLKREPREDMDVKDCEINDKTALRYIGIVLDRDGKFQFQTAYRPLPIPVGGYSHEITYNKICSVESTMMRHHQENKFEFSPL
ncbi:unnamed protein product [Vicia faba]|uniref:Uncharacterized protein n=1 Tax=Vicia faba TaxID=3906 RepID=A0AAV1A8Z5_VICFA|nr:unnamed protein product [Vicia faba]